MILILLPSTSAFLNSAQYKRTHNNKKSQFTSKKDSRKNKNKTEMANLEIYPLSNYGLGDKEPKQENDFSRHHRIAHMERIYKDEGMRRTVEGILLVHENNHPHALIFRVRDGFWRLPGGKLRPGETEIEGLKRKLSSKLGATFLLRQPDWKIGECVVTWWRPEFEKHMYYPLSYSKYIPKPKERKKLFVVHLSEQECFMVPKNLQLFAVPLYDLYDNAETYGMVISSIAHQLSRFQIKMMNPQIDKGPTCT